MDKFAIFVLGLWLGIVVIINIVSYMQRDKNENNRDS